MRILLDESLPRKLGQELAGHEVRTVQQIGWAGFKNGELLRQASGKFDVLVTGDQIWSTSKTLLAYPSPLSYSLR